MLRKALRSCLSYYLLSSDTESTRLLYVGSDRSIFHLCVCSFDEEFSESSFVSGQTLKVINLSNIFKIKLSLNYSS